MSVLSKVKIRRSNCSGCSIILISKVCCGSGGVIVMKHEFGLILIADATRRRKLVYILFIKFLIFRLLTTEDLRKRIERRLKEQRSEVYNPSMTMLIPQEGEKVWGEKRPGNKVDMIAEIVGYRHRINTGRDQACMQRYITRVSRAGLDQPSVLNSRQFLPVDAPLLDFLVEDAKGVEGWRYPKLDDLKLYQAERGLNLKMLDRIEVRELVCWVSSDQEIEQTREWIKKMQGLDQDRFCSQVVSLDVEDVKTTYYDTLRMAGKLSIDPKRAVLRTSVETDLAHGYSKDGWKQVPGKIMFGNGITWTCLISLDLEMNGLGDYVLKQVTVQPGIVELLRDLPVSAGLAIRRDVRGIEEFYSLVTGMEVRLERGFLDLTSLAILAGYKFHSKNMTAMGVQVQGTLLNKTVSTGDNMWGIRWREIPKALQCYALGDIKFGFITYNVLAGLLLRDVFPDPDMLCRYLKCDQGAAVSWFLEFVMISLEGVEYHQVAEEQAQTRDEMVRSLRLRDCREKLCEFSPPYVKVWAEILGAWPSPTFGGCRFLLQCREWFVTQMRIIAGAKIQWSDGRVIRQPRDTDLEYARFGMTPEEIGEQTWMDPVSGIRGLRRPDGVRIPLLSFEVSTAKSTDIGSKCTEIGRSQRWSLLEWARMEPERLKGFFTRMTRDVGFQRFYCSIYDPMRLCYRRIFDEPISKIPAMDDALNKAVRNNLKDEESGLGKAMAEVLVREKRVSGLISLTKDWEFEERTRWRENVPVLAGWKHRSGRKRVGSQSGAKSGKVKKRRLRSSKSGAEGISGVEASGRSPSQPAPGLPGVGNELGNLANGLHQGEETEEVVFLDENDEVMVKDEPEAVPSNLKPVKKRLSSALKRSSSKKVRPRTYDEMIEGVGDEDEFPDNLDFEFEIPKEVEDFEF